MNKEEKYAELLQEIKAVTERESDIIANMANISAMIQEAFGFWWTGFYRVTEDVLVLGPFQGPMACTRIKKGKGVCGTCWEKKETIIVPNVHEFEDHIACSSASNSEIVCPIYNEERNIIGVLDIDSQFFNTFDKTDQYWLEKIVKVLQ